MAVKDIINKQTIHYLKQIEAILSQESNERTAVYYRHHIHNRFNAYCKDKSDSNGNKSVICDDKCCAKCLSHLNAWRIKPKRSRGRSGHKCINKLVSKCQICHQINTFDGICKASDAKTPLKTPKVRPNAMNSTFSLGNTSAHTPRTPRTPMTRMNVSGSGAKSGSEPKSRQEALLQNLLNSNKKRKVDQKTGLFDFLQICTQNQ